MSPQIGINPGLLSAYKGHHYPNPGNHFCRWSLTVTLKEERVTSSSCRLLMTSPRLDFGPVRCRVSTNIWLLVPPQGNVCSCPVSLTSSSTTHTTRCCRRITASASPTWWRGPRQAARTFPGELQTQVRFLGGRTSVTSVFVCQ